MHVKLAYFLPLQLNYTIKKEAANKSWSKNHNISAYDSLYKGIDKLGNLTINFVLVKYLIQQSIVSLWNLPCLLTHNNCIQRSVRTVYQEQSLQV